MTYQRFCQILTEEGLRDAETHEKIWRTRPSDDLDEVGIRYAANELAVKEEASTSTIH